MLKKGFSAHIDWVIGIGIFLVYLGMVFIIFKPGVTPVFDSETLLDIVENNFIDYNVSNGGAWWNISKTPVFVTPTHYGSTNGADCAAQDPIKQPALVELKGFSSTLSDMTHFGTGDSATRNELFYIPENNADLVNAEASRSAVYENRNAGEGNNEAVRFARSENGANVPPLSQEETMRPLSVGFGLNPTLSFIAPFKNDGSTLKFLLLHSEAGDINKDGGLVPPQQRNNQNVPNLWIGGFKEGCSFGDEVPSESPCGTAFWSCIAKYDVGTTEYVEGINLANVPDKSKYDEIKKLWKFPESKDFQIVIYDQYQNIFQNGRFPDFPLPDGVNVYSRQVNTFILDKDGIRIPVTVNYMVW